MNKDSCCFRFSFFMFFLVLQNNQTIIFMFRISVSFFQFADTFIKPSLSFQKHHTSSCRGHAPPPPNSAHPEVKGVCVCVPGGGGSMDQNTCAKQAHDRMRESASPWLPLASCCFAILIFFHSTFSVPLKLVFEEEVIKKDKW